MAGGAPADLHGLVLAVSAQVERGSVSQQDCDAVLMRIVVWWLQICSPKVSLSCQRSEGRPRVPAPARGPWISSLSFPVLGLGAPPAAPPS